MRDAVGWVADPDEHELDSSDLWPDLESERSRPVADWLILPGRSRDVAHVVVSARERVRWSIERGQVTLRDPALSVPRGWTGEHDARVNFPIVAQLSVRLAGEGPGEEAQLFWLPPPVEGRVPGRV